MILYDIQSEQSSTATLFVDQDTAITLGINKQS